MVVGVILWHAIKSYARRSYYRLSALSGFLQLHRFGLTRIGLGYLKVRTKVNSKTKRTSEF